MTKMELEERIGYEVTQEGWVELEKMYMACDLDKDAYAELVKVGARKYRVVKQTRIEYRGCIIIDAMSCEGYAIYTRKWDGIEMTHRLGYFVDYAETIKEAKAKIKG